MAPSLLLVFLTVLTIMHATPSHAWWEGGQLTVVCFPSLLWHHPISSLAYGHHLPPCCIWLSVKTLLCLWQQAFATGEAGLQ